MNVALKTLPAHHQLNGVFGSYYGAVCRFIFVLVNTTSKVDEDQLFYCRSRGMSEEEAVALVVNGFCREVLQALPMEFAMEAQSLVAISLEGSVG